MTDTSMPHASPCFKVELLCVWSVRIPIRPKHDAMLPMYARHRRMFNPSYPPTAFSNGCRLSHTAVSHSRLAHRIDCRHHHHRPGTPFHFVFLITVAAFFLPARPFAGIPLVQLMHADPDSNPPCPPHITSTHSHPSMQIHRPTGVSRYVGSDLFLACHSLPPLSSPSESEKTRETFSPLFLLVYHGPGIPDCMSVPVTSRDTTPVRRFSQ